MSEKLRAGDWNFIAYRERLAAKAWDVPPRRISISAARDRVPLQVLNTALTFAAPHAKREAPQNVTRRLIASARSTGFDHIVRLDIRNFYPTVTHEAVSRELERHISVNAVRTLVKRAIRTPTIPDNTPAVAEPQSRGVPQGLAISNSVAELVMRDFDTIWRSEDDLEYFRYADDMIFLSKRDKHQQIYRRVKRDLSMIGIAPHPFTSDGKSRWLRLQDGIDFLGYRIGAHEVSVRPHGIHRLKRSLALTFERYSVERNSASPQKQLLAGPRLEWFLNLRITGCVLDNQSRGWVQYYSLLEDFGLLRDLDYYVQSLGRRHDVADWLSPRSFVHTYRKWARRAEDKSGYIPDFDEYELDDKRAILSEVFGISEQRMNSNGERWVAHEFARRTRLHVHSMERDLTPKY